MSLFSTTMAISETKFL